MPKTKILIVDDEPLIRNLCVAVLSRHDFDPILASNGQEGLEAYRERHEEIGLVLSDVSMPVMTGIEMARNILELYSDANVILMSGRGLSEIVPDELRRLCSVIDKPFTPGALLEAVKKCVRCDKEQSHALSN